MPNITIITKLSAVCLGGVALVVLMIAYQIIYYRFIHPLAGFPGPFWASVTRIWIAYHSYMEDEISTFQKLQETYGKFLSLSTMRTQANLPSNQDL